MSAQRNSWIRIACLLIALVGVCLRETPGQDLSAGAAAVVITPPQGTPMAGYYSARAAQEVHDDLFAKALVIQSGEVKAALVVLDLISAPRDLVEDARAAINKATGMPSEHVMISATHAHTGPVLSGRSQREDDLGGASDIARAYRAALPEKIAQAVAEAAKKVVPARALAARAREDSIAFNRRFHMKDGTVGWNPGKLNPAIVKPAGPIDPDVPIITFERAEDSPKPIATYVNYAVHLDNIGGELISADLPGILSRALGEAMDSDMVTLWTAGCCGDINHIDVKWARPQKGLDNAARMGTILASAVLRAGPRLQPVAQGPLQIQSTIVLLPPPAFTEEEVLQARDVVERRKGPAEKQPGFLDSVKAYKVLDLVEQAGKPREAEVQVITLGRDVAWVALPGEIFVELGLEIKQDSPFPMTIPVELANGSLGYIPTRRAYKQGNYEVVSARVAQGSGEMLVDAAVKILGELYEKAPSPEVKPAP